MIRQYLGPFVMTFFISIFVLVMQFLWKYIDELAGKGLEWTVILELIIYASATLVPMALPLAILLSSIMTMGAVAEHLELVAAKSAGISLLKIMRPLMMVALLTSAFAFFFSNNVMPVANYKLKNLLFAIRRTKPAIDIQPKVFYDGIQGLVVKVEEKGKDEKTFYDLMIYDHSKESIGAGSVTMARRGVINISDDNRYLSFKLFEGIRYDDREFFSEQKSGLPFIREQFAEQEILIDLSQFLFSRENSSLIKNQYSMMTVSQLNEVHKELVEDIRQSGKNYTTAIRNRYKPLYSQQIEDNSEVFNPEKFDQKDFEIPVDMEGNDLSKTPDSVPPQPVIEHISFKGGSFLSFYRPDQQSRIINTALTQVKEIENTLSAQGSVIKSKQGQIARNEIEVHRKLSLSVACIILFFVGAPLGAIIRKGGLGWPMIFSILIFITYYMISTIGEKSARQLAMSSFEGMWLSSFILAPVGLFLTLKASTDSPIFAADTYSRLIRKLARRKKV